MYQIVKVKSKDEEMTDDGGFQSAKKKILWKADRLEPSKQYICLSGWLRRCSQPVRRRKSKYMTADHCSSDLGKLCAYLAAIGR
jgi:hypothetical protein